MKPITKLLVTLLFFVSFGYSNEISFELDGENLLFSKDGHKSRFEIFQYKKSEDKSLLEKSFKESFGFSLSLFLKSKRDIKTTDKETIDLLEQIKSFPSLNLSLMNYSQYTCAGNSEDTFNLMKRERPFEREGDVLRNSRIKDKCEKLVRKIYDPYKKAKIIEFDASISKKQLELDSIISKFNDSIVKTPHNELYFTTKVDYKDLSDFLTEKIFTCQLMFPQKKSLDDFIDLFPDDGPINTDTLLANNTLRLFNKQKSDAESSCETKRRIMSGFKSLEGRASKEAEFRSIIAKDVFCRIHKNDKLNKKIINEVKVRLAKLKTENSELKTSLQNYLTQLTYINTDNYDSGDYDNVLWTTMFNNMKSNCSVEPFEERSASEIAVSIAPFLELNYRQDCLDSNRSLLYYQCQKQAIEFGVDLGKKLKIARANLKKVEEAKSKWHDSTSSCHKKFKDRCNSAEPSYSIEELRKCMP
ncbi:hypothetical protein M902_2850 [Bacteriovorax sp. BAL6_X]|uniref:hypothetical protein n=1 Tax=Bacteriovorax sp. BAL6_X TaxID=1201290 RepID=UPI0003863488|nr:hypothetical protein [Bacteriovorax sp. BAL6_X]EPZ50994.1 hypothetical protein M902_2850 [Bacteriovorax sp. BAL6_X]